jgi:hypothetical protein
MSYRIPPAGILAEAITEALSDRPMVVSQQKLTAMVLKKLREKDPEYTATEERVRKLAIDRNLAKIEIHTREADERSRHGRCPVCSSKMRRIQNETVFGGTVTLGHKCTKCPYWTGMNRRIPICYVFYGDYYRRPSHKEL